MINNEMNKYKNLIPVDGWTIPKKKYCGRYCDDKDNALNGLYRRDYKENSVMLAINNGNVVRRYKYPKIQIPFNSKMVRWQNLHFCGGLGIPRPEGTNAGANDELLQAVIDGLKPVGFIITDKPEIYINEAMESQCKYIINNNVAWLQNYKEVAIANSGKLKDNFDLNSLIESYRLMSIEVGWNLLTKEDESRLLSKGNCNLSDFLVDWDYANPKSNYDLALTGLLLGFPIESTVAIMIE
jgi:hypothetical protein